jgi:hypothetical protein
MNICDIQTLNMQLFSDTNGFRIVISEEVIFFFSRGAAAQRGLSPPHS